LELEEEELLEWLCSSSESDGLNIGFKSSEEELFDFSLFLSALIRFLLQDFICMESLPR
jgi:hypothetical protein